ncbi:PREDICTED: WAS/WASL-interacting protein family member 3-like, partial [Chinchilla lanigera]|uniref:WAS/WASL-interacting protein family member 3-like n=1 Tax=Chinchilla lanigera TaxID=34839 RepID=UPI000698E75A
MLQNSLSIQDCKASRRATSRVSGPLPCLQDPGPLAHSQTSGWKPADHTSWGLEPGELPLGGASRTVQPENAKSPGQSQRACCVAHADTWTLSAQGGTRLGAVATSGTQAGGADPRLSSARAPFPHGRRQDVSRECPDGLGLGWDRQGPGAGVLRPCSRPARPRRSGRSSSSAWPSWVLPGLPAPSSCGPSRASPPSRPPAWSPDYPAAPSRRPRPPAGPALPPAPPSRRP